MPNQLSERPTEADVRFQGYRLEVISQWAPSPRKVALAEAISQRLTSIGRRALVRPDIADLLNLSCRLLDDFFAAKDHVRGEGGRLNEGAVHAAVDVY